MKCMALLATQGLHGVHGFDVDPGTVLYLNRVGIQCVGWGIQCLLSFRTVGVVMQATLVRSTATYTFLWNI